MSDRFTGAPHGTVGEEFWSRKQPEARSGNFDPLSYFRTVLKYRWPIALVTALVTALAIAYVLSAEPLYKSTQALLLETSESNIVAIENLVKDAPENEGYVQTRIEMLKSREHARRVIGSLELLSDDMFMKNLAKASRMDVDHLMNAAKTAAKAAEAIAARQLTASTAALQPGNDGKSALVPVSESEIESLAIDYFLSRLSISQVPTTRLVRISYLSPNPELAARIANEVGTQYIQAYVESVQTQVTSVSSWLDVRLAELKLELDNSEAGLQSFKEENQLIGIRGNMGGLSEQELLQTSREMADARIELSNSRIVLDALERASSTNELIEVLPGARSDIMIQQTRVDINRLSREIDRELLRYGEQHPRIIALRSELSSLRADLDRSVLRLADAARSDYGVSQRRVDSLELSLQSDRDALQNVAAKSAKLELLEKEVDANRELYYRFLSRMIETKSTEGLESVNATVAEFALPALSPVAPNKALIVGLAFIGALFLSIIAALISNGLDDSVKHPSDLPNSIGERLIAIIPMFRKKEPFVKRLNPFSGKSQNYDARRFSEAFTTARTKLILDQEQKANKVLLVTSSIPGEGKSMSSIGLARAFACIERVLLIDADIRRPSLGAALKFEKDTPGLTSYLASKSPLTDCIHHNQSGGFDVLCSGPVTNQPLELLSSQLFEQMLRNLEKIYDRIIIDCAPVEAVSDALVLSRVADQVIYVVKSHDTSARIVNSGLSKLHGVDAPVAGVLLSQVDLDKLSSYGADSEFHGLYDYYGYSLPESEESLTLNHSELRRHYRKSKPKPRRLSSTAA
ncbi:MAG: GumC family protein [Granulosicoccus sp.]